MDNYGIGFVFPCHSEGGCAARGNLGNEIATASVRTGFAMTGGGKERRAEEQIFLKYV